jgi:hypothetical protein
MIKVQLNVVITLFLVSYLVCLEILNQINSISEMHVLASVIFSSAIALCSSFQIFKRRTVASETTLKKSAKREALLTRQSISESILVFIIFAYLTLSAVLGLIHVPNNWDSMTYHLPRIEHWLQSGTFDFYQTPIKRQIWQSELSPKLLLIPRSVSSDPNLLNLAQLTYLLLTLALVLSILQKMQVSKLRILGLIGLFVTAPNVISQASTTQNDILVALIVVLNLSFLQEIINFKSNSFLTFFLYSASIGILFSGKATALPFAFFSLMTYVVYYIRYHRKERFVQHSAIRSLVLVLCVIPLNISLWVKNSLNYGNPLGSEGFHKIGPSALVSNFSLTEFATNGLRFVIYNLQTYSQTLNDALFQIGYKIANSLGLNLKSEGSAWPNWLPEKGSYEMFFGTSFGINEDAAVSSFYLVALFLNLVLVITLVIKRSKDWQLHWVSILAAAYFLALIFILRWNPWHDRYFIAPFIVSLVAIAIVKKKSRMESTLIPILVVASSIYSLPYLFLNTPRPLIGQNSILKISEMDQQFLSRPQLSKSLSELKELAQQRSVKTFILDLNGDDWEYPIWVVANELNIKVYNLEQIEIRALKADALKICYFKCKSQNTGLEEFIIGKSSIPNLNLSERYYFNSSDLIQRTLIQGWSGIEDWGVWSDGDESVLKFSIDHASADSAKINLDYILFNNNPTSETVLQIKSIKGVVVDEINYDEAASNQNKTLALSDFRIQDGSYTLVFHFLNLKSPKELGVTEDSRKIGIGLISFEILNKNIN